MTELENRFFEEYKKLDLLIKKKLGKENGISDYIEDMVRRYSAVPANPNYRQILKELKHIRWVRNNIAHSEEDSECKESDIYIASYFYNQICKDEDPLAKVIVKQQAIKQNQYISNSESTKKDNSFEKIKKYKIFKGIVTLLTFLITILYIVPLFCVFLTSKFNVVEYEKQKEKSKKVGYAGTEDSFFAKDEKAQEIFENIAFYWTRQDLAKYLKPLVNTVTNPGEVTKILEEELNIDVNESDVDVNSLVEELNNQ